MKICDSVHVQAGRKATLLVGSLAHLILAVFVASLLLVYRDSSHVVTVIVVVLICVYALSLSLTWLYVNCPHAATVVLPLNNRSL